MTFSRRSMMMVILTVIALAGLFLVHRKTERPTPIAEYSSMDVAPSVTPADALGAWLLREGRCALHTRRYRSARRAAALSRALIPSERSQTLARAIDRVQQRAFVRWQDQARDAQRAGDYDRARRARARAKAFAPNVEEDG